MNLIVAQVGAQTGHKVTLVDISQNVLDKSQARINESIKRVAKKKFKDDANAGDKFITEAIGRLNIATNPDEALSTADLVVEAVTENLDLKKKLFTGYDQVAPKKTIFASNTSSLAIGDIAVSCPQRLGNKISTHNANYAIDNFRKGMVPNRLRTHIKKILCYIKLPQA